MLSDEPALLAAVHADPADDTPRLVYADWLDEHCADPVPCHCAAYSNHADNPWGPGHLPEGDGWTNCKTCNSGGGSDIGTPGWVIDRGPRQDFAEFIRVQVELARRAGDDCWEARYNAGSLPADHPVMRRQNSGRGISREMLDRLNAYSARLDALRSRQSALLTARGREWSREVATALGVHANDIAVWDDGWLTVGDYRWRFERGLPFSVRVPTLAEAVGDRDCRRCEGTILSYVHPRPVPANWTGQTRGGWPVESCSSCRGLGRVRACGACAGTGVTQVSEPTAVRMPPCAVCSGSGTLPPVVSLLPPTVGRVVPADRVPFEGGHGFVWLRGHENTDYRLSREHVPPPVFDLMQPDPNRVTTDPKPTAALAVDALAAAVAWVGRKRIARHAHDQ